MYNDKSKVNMINTCSIVSNAWLTTLRYSPPITRVSTEAMAFASEFKIKTIFFLSLAIQIMYQNRGLV